MSATVVSTAALAASTASLAASTSINSQSGVRSFSALTLQVFLIAIPIVALFLGSELSESRNGLVSWVGEWMYDSVTEHIIRTELIMFLAWIVFMVIVRIIQ